MRGVTLPILKVGRPFAVNREFRTVSTVHGSSQFLTVAISTLITALETLLFSKVRIDCVMGNFEKPLNFPFGLDP